MRPTEQLRELEVGEVFARLKKSHLKDYDAASAHEFCRTMQSSTLAMAGKIDKKKFTVERIDCFTTDREHIVYGVVVTRIK